MIKTSGSKGLGRLVTALADPTNSRFQTRVAILLLAFEALLLAAIIARVPCTFLLPAAKGPPCSPDPLGPPEPPCSRP